MSDAAANARQKALEIAMRLSMKAGGPPPSLSPSPVPKFDDSAYQNSLKRPRPPDEPLGAGSQFPVSDGLMHADKKSTLPSSLYDSAAPSAPPPDVKIINVPDNKVGLVIGKGGETIKQFQSQTSCHIQIATKEEAPNPLLRPITLTGTQSQIAAAESLILNVTADKIMPSKSSVPPAAPGEISVLIKIPNNKVGLLIGKSGDTIKQLQAQTGARVQVTKDAETAFDAAERTCTLQGTPANIEALKQQIKILLESGPAPAGVAMPTGFNSPIQRPIKIPNSTVGLLIGKQGETIKQFQNETGGRIQISKDDTGEYRDITLCGANHMEVEMLHKKVKDLVDMCLARQGKGGTPGVIEGGPYAQGGAPLTGALAAAAWQQQQVDPHQAAWAQYYQQQYYEQAMAADPYAAYGGYEAYCAQWQAYYASQPQPPPQYEYDPAAPAANADAAAAPAVEGGAVAATSEGSAGEPTASGAQVAAGEGDGAPPLSVAVAQDSNGGGGSGGGGDDDGLEGLAPDCDDDEVTALAIKQQ